MIDINKLIKDFLDDLEKTTPEMIIAEIEKAKEDSKDERWFYD